MATTTVALPGFGGTDLRFWKIQALVWSAYAAALMLPWLGVYPVMLMLPNKVVIAGTGLLVSAGLREIYRSVGFRRSRKDITVVALVASVVGGFVWSAATAELSGWSVAELVRTSGMPVSGVPQLFGVWYHALVLLTWSIGYLGWTDRAPAAHPCGLDRLVLRDGRRSVVLRSGEIEWVSARGDYVQVHLGGRCLLLRNTISRIAATLPAGQYVRIHRSAIVNVICIREVVPLRNRECRVILSDGTELRASRTYAEDLRNTVLGGREG